MNRGFFATLVLLCLAAEVLLRALPALDDRAFRIAYGNSLSVYLAIEARLREHGREVEVLALGDSLTMTQFEPEVFAAATGRPTGSVFNAGYLGMSFPSLVPLLERIGRAGLPALDRVLLFVNPRRFSVDEETARDVFRIGIADRPLREAWERREVSPLLDLSRLYGLSRHLLLTAWRDVLRPRDTWDQVERLRLLGGVEWPHLRDDPAPPAYPYPPLADLSEQRLAEFDRVLALLDDWGVEVLVVTSPIHPALSPFATPAAARAYRDRVADRAERHGARFLPELGAGFAPPDDRDFADYGHMNDSGAAAYTRLLARNLHAAPSDRKARRP